MQQILEFIGNGAAVKGAMLKAAIVLGMITLSVSGSFAYKKAAALTEWAPLFFSLGGAAWLLSATCFVALLKSGPLGIWGPLTAVIQVALVMVVSATILNESYSTGQWIATSIAVTAMGISMALNS